jgi:hypothetical protein
MFTQRERIAMITRRIKKHNFFEGPFELSREEAAFILDIFSRRENSLNKQHERYMANQDHFQQKGRERYAAKKDAINEKRRQKRLEEVIERAFK